MCPQHFLTGIMAVNVLVCQALGGFIISDPCHFNLRRCEQNCHNFYDDKTTVDKCIADCGRELQDSYPVHAWHPYNDDCHQELHVSSDMP